MAWFLEQDFLLPLVLQGRESIVVDKLNARNSPGRDTASPGPSAALAVCFGLINRLFSILPTRLNNGCCEVS